jgi:hypothetical protein
MQGARVIPVVFSGHGSCPNVSGAHVDQPGQRGGVAVLPRAGARRAASFLPDQLSVDEV